MTDGAAAAGHWIGGAWTGARPDAASTNPARPEEEIIRFALATTEEVDTAVGAAAAALPGWSRSGGVARSQALGRVAAALSRRAEELADLLVAEEGKTAAEAQGEVARAVATLQYNAARALAPSGESYDSATPGLVARTRRVPVGVVAIITPWNFPVAIPIWKLAPALAHGNTVVWKPSELTPATSVVLAEVLDRAGLPDGVVNLVLGDGSAGEHLVADSRVDAISFTGSVPVGERILQTAGPRGARIQLELGGHNPALVFDDANVEQAAADVVAGAMLSTGQKCTATRRVLAADAVYDELLKQIVRRTLELRIGDGADADTDLGPLISDAARTRVTAALDRAAQQGVTTLVGGGPPEDPRSGHFLCPTVLAADSHDADICHEEVFGPVTTILRISDDDEAFALANATQYGLSAAVHTRSAPRVRRALEEIDAGMLTVNGPTTGADLHVPFGGVKASSGPGPREMGEAAREFFTTTRTAYLDADLAL